MTEGVVARIMDHGYGFISQEGVEKDLFFHSSELTNVEFNELQEGDKVTFELGDGPKGPCATGVAKA